ncbi:MAG: NupC/NupG family nucleoside CNT transporter [Planctomycetota bacterium]
MNTWTPLLGMLVLLLIAFALSENRAAIKWRTVLGALGLQICLGALVFYVPAGKRALQATAFGVARVISYANDGIGFLFGQLVAEESSIGFIFALNVLPIIIFFSSLIAVLYYLGIMQLIINTLGGALRLALGTSRAESLSATANIFVGQTEAPLVVRPYIARMTESELFAVMCGGLASVAGSVLAGYAKMGVDLKYLLAACFMSAPAGLLFAKLIKPETGQPEEDLALVEDHSKPTNVLDAAALGASSGMRLAANVGAMLLAFISLIALLNGLFGLVGSWFGFEDLTLQGMLGYVFAPLAWLIGVPWAEATQGGSFIGQKLIVNEFVAYGEFVTVKQDLAPRTQAVISIALCGFANLSSIAILLGGLGGIAPTRREEIARFGLKAVAAGTLANLMSAAIAGFFFSLSNGG